MLTVKGTRELTSVATKEGMSAADSRKMATKSRRVCFLSGLRGTTVHSVGRRMCNGHCKMTHGHCTCWLISNLSFASADIYGPKCLSCEEVESPSDCLHTKRCWAHEQCFTEHLANSSGATWYNFGCRIIEECSLLESSIRQRRGVEPTITLCERCCTGDACNTHLCSTTTGNQSLSCFSCDATDDPNDCHVVKHCDPHEVCYSESVIEDTPVPRHTLGCVSQSFCDLLTGNVIGRRTADNREKRKTHLCQKCCHTSGCNSDVCFSQQPIPQTTRIPFKNDIRLVGMNSSMAGRLEVYHDSQWGTVCDDSFEAESARMACRQLGFSGETALILPNKIPGSGPIWLDDVRCYGYESSLFACGHRNWGDNNCGHHEDIVLRCRYDSVGIRLVGLNSPVAGRLEVSIGTDWGTVCNDFFTRESARVACRQLGLPNEQVFILGNIRLPGTGSIWLDEVRCEGNETSLLSCNHRGLGQGHCQHREDIVIRCGLDLKNSTVRLVNGSSYSEGRVEVLYNGTWGAVCDNSFNHKAARVGSN
ncbi:scavenger receptor cysteine-rich type 1 protein M130-like [Liolophura sinensis]|uniref:scavenger receptor cysteine-rich type 1 protein M130-like n=1 Tax=Liolophura sinensis TaxID=3198878 RepID=UPI003158DFD8